MPAGEKKLYLSFDDGPEPEVTNFVLDQLALYNAKATFFCIGKNVENNPDVFKRILEDGHAVGNHTYDHLNGFKTKNELYLDNILSAKRSVNSRLFRPPYGRMRSAQSRKLKQHGFETVMWSVLSGDFDLNIDEEKCYRNVVNNAKNGDIIVFHDSLKAGSKIRYALPLVLKFFNERNFVFEKIERKN